MQISRKLGLTLVAAALVTVYGCGQKTETKSEAKTTTGAATPAAAPAEEVIVIKIGHAGPLTGGIAHLGKDDENGVHLAIDEANDKKIKIGGKTAKFEMMSEDDQADPKLGPTIAQKMVDAKVVGVAGHLNSGVSIPASAVYNQAGIPMISGSATNPKLTEQGFKTIFRTVGRDDQQGPAVAAYIANELKLKKVAIADDATAYGEGLANEVEKTLKAAGVQVVTREKTNDKATDFKAILTKMKGRNPDAIFYGGMDATGGPMLKQARELGIKAQFAFGDGACTAEMAKLAGDKASEGMICSQAGIPTQMASKSFQDAFTKKYGEVKQYAPFFYDAANIIIVSLQKADSTDPAKIVPEIAKIQYDGATGHIEFDEKGDRKDAEMTIFQMKGGKVEPVAIIKAGKTTKVDSTSAGAAPPAQAPTAASTMAPATPATATSTMAPAAPAKEEAPKK
jgi:branched-chain amino acid transport system substrate-binding protein